MPDQEKSQMVRSETRAILMADWDPIGVNDVPEAADECDSYIGGVYELPEQGASAEGIRAYLRRVEIEAMEMVDASGEPFLRDEARNAAAASLKAITRYFQWLRSSLSWEATICTDSAIVPTSHSFGIWK
jgi:hypothetical protein